MQSLVKLFTNIAVRKGKLHLTGSLVLLCMLSFSFSDSQAVSLKGSFISTGQGYQDISGDDHFIFAPGLRLTGRDFGINGLSLHTYFQQYGDTYGNFNDTGGGRLYHGYFQYMKKDSPVNARLGRFFLFRGVAVGVLDGAEVSYSINKDVGFTAFGGLSGPLNREWELSTNEPSPMFGGEVRWAPKYFREYATRVAFSYTHQQNDGDLIRHLAGINFSFRLNRYWRSFNAVQMDLASSGLRKALTRWRYNRERLHFSIDGSIISPYAAAYSYFSGFEMEGLTYRVRNTVEYHFVPRKWGAGLSTLFFTTGKYGLKTGPYLIFPYGRIGYHFSTGDQPNNNVLWGNIKYSPLSYLDVYAYAANMEYEWESMGIDNVKTTMLNLGFAVRPPILKTTELGLEWQNYSTPQLKSERRILLNFRWNFDYEVGQ